jgi:metal-responsive CopG/Arc/MetJ family transcriptional regulator
MSVNKLPLPPAPAKRGTKVGWKVVGGEVPPKVADDFQQIALREGVSRSELFRRVVTEFVSEKKAA